MESLSDVFASLLLDAAGTAEDDAQTVEPSESHIATDWFELNLPEQWVGKVSIDTWTRDYDGAQCVTLVPVELPELTLATFNVVDASAHQVGGDGILCVQTWDCGAKRVELWVPNWMYEACNLAAGRDSRLLDASEAELMVGLMSGGQLSWADAEAFAASEDPYGRSMAAFDFVREEVVPAVAVRDSFAAGEQVVRYWRVSTLTEPPAMYSLLIAGDEWRVTEASLTDEFGGTTILHGTADEWGNLVSDGGTECYIEDAFGRIEGACEGDLWVKTGASLADQDAAVVLNNVWYADRDRALAASGLGTPLQDQHVVANGLELYLPEYWLGKVAIKTDADSRALVVYPVGYPDVRLLWFNVVDASETVNAGGMGSSLIDYWDDGRGNRIELWCHNALYFAWELARSGGSLVGPFSNVGELRTALDLTTCGSWTLEDAAALGTDGSELGDVFMQGYALVQDVVAPSVVVSQDVMTESEAYRDLRSLWERLAGYDERIASLAGDFNGAFAACDPEWMSSVLASADGLAGEIGNEEALAAGLEVPAAYEWNLREIRVLLADLRERVRPMREAASAALAWGGDMGMHADEVLAPLVADNDEDGVNRNKKDYVARYPGAEPQAPAGLEITDSVAPQTSGTLEMLPGADGRPSIPGTRVSMGGYSIVLPEGAQTTPMGKGDDATWMYEDLGVLYVGNCVTVADSSEFESYDFRSLADRLVGNLGGSDVYSLSAPANLFGCPVFGFYASGNGCVGVLLPRADGVCDAVFIVTSNYEWLTYAQGIIASIRPVDVELLGQLVPADLYSTDLGLLGAVPSMSASERLAAQSVLEGQTSPDSSFFGLDVLPGTDGAELWMATVVSNNSTGAWTMDQITGLLELCGIDDPIFNRPQLSYSFDASDSTENMVTGMYDCGGGRMASWTFVASQGIPIVSVVVGVAS